MTLRHGRDYRPPIMTTGAEQAPPNPMTALSVEEFGAALNEVGRCWRMEGCSRSGQERANHKASAAKAEARVLEAYAAVCRERDEWSALKDNIGRDLGDALGRVQELTDEVGRLRGACETFCTWLDREEAGSKDQPWSGKRDTPEGEAAWREWYYENLRLCDLAQKQARAALSGEAHAAVVAVSRR